MLAVAEEAWARQLTIGELPSQTNFDLPLPPTGADAEDEDKQRAFYRRRRKVEQRNSNLHSLRCDTSIKLGIARQFRDDVIYFPYNIDFRGRAYPVPPNLNHLGSDLCRGFLRFAKEKPLGPTGLYWMKVQLANL